MPIYLYKTLKYVIPAVACLIFINQVYRHHVHDLSTWKGGGMGMFAAWDRPSRARFVRIYVDTDKAMNIPVSGSGGRIGAIAYALTTEPSETNSKALADALSRKKWFYQDKPQRLLTRTSVGNLIEIGSSPTLGPVGDAPALLRRITVVYGEIRYDITQKTLSPHVVKERSYDYQ